MEVCLRLCDLTPDTTDSSFSQVVLRENTLLPSFTPLTSLGDGKYFWHVRAFNSAAQPGSFSATQIFTVDTTPPFIGSVD